MQYLEQAVLSCLLLLLTGLKSCFWLGDCSQKMSVLCISSPTLACAFPLLCKNLRGEPLPEPLWDKPHVSFWPQESMRR